MDIKYYFIMKQRKIKKIETPYAGISESDYQIEKRRLQVELLKIQQRLIKTNQKLVEELEFYKEKLRSTCAMYGL